MLACRCSGDAPRDSPRGAGLGYCAALARSAASRRSWDVMRGRVRYHTRSSAPRSGGDVKRGRVRPRRLETLLGLRHSCRSSDHAHRTAETPQTSGERRVACDRREQADQADSDAPLTALCPVPMPLSDLFRGGISEREKGVQSNESMTCWPSPAPGNASRLHAEAARANRKTRADSVTGQREPPAATASSQPPAATASRQQPAATASDRRHRQAATGLARRQGSLDDHGLGPDPEEKNSINGAVARGAGL